MLKKFTISLEKKNKDYKKALNEEGEARPSGFERPDVAGKHSFERRPDRPSDRSSDRPSRPNFKTDRLDRPDRRFAAAHAEDDSERAPFVPGKRYFGDDRADGRPARKDFVAKRPVKKRFKDDEVFGDKKKFGDKKFGDKKFGDRKFGDKKFGNQSFKKPFKRRDDDDLDD